MDLTKRSGTNISKKEAVGLGTVVEVALAITCHLQPFPNIMDSVPKIPGFT